MKCAECVPLLTGKEENCDEENDDDALPLSDSAIMLNGVQCRVMIEESA